MTNDVANNIAQALLPLYRGKILTVLGGLVRTAKTVKDGATLFFPVPFGQNDQPVQMENSKFTPNSNERAILYFEGSNATVTRSTKNKSVMSANLRLVCWYNSKMFQIDSGKSLHQTLISAVLAHLAKVPTHENGILALKLRHSLVVDSTAALFSKYSYKEERAQYLSEPYFAFGVDIVATYQINHFSEPNCNGTIIPVDVDSCP